jgi:hypothetical protein
MERRFFLAILLSFAVLYGYQALFVPAGTYFTHRDERTLGHHHRTNRPKLRKLRPARLNPMLPLRRRPPRVERRARDRGRYIHGTGSPHESGRAPLAVAAEGISRSERQPGGSGADRHSARSAPALLAFGGRRRESDPTDLNSVVYRASGDRDGHVDATSSDGKVVFEFSGADGLKVRKEFGFAPTNYIVTFSAL